MASCGGLATRLPALLTQPAKPIDNRPQVKQPARIAASRKREPSGFANSWRLADYQAADRPQADEGRRKRLPHRARETNELQYKSARLPFV
jgi:hypothetical protein